jgi:predicted acyl esterase
MSKGTSEAFFDVIEWCADQPWSSGKVGLLGISYYAGTQWRVAARKPKGLAAMIPWEGIHLSPSEIQSTMLIHASKV